MRLSDLAERLRCRFEGDGALDVVRVAGIERAGPGDLTFFANPKYAAHLRATRASVVILGDTMGDAPCAVIRSPHPYLTFAEAVALFDDTPQPAPGVHPTAIVASSVRLAPGVSVGAFAVIDDRVTIGSGSSVGPHTTIGAEARIGAGCRIRAHVSIRERVTLGDRVVVQDGAVIGSDGFGFARRPDGTHQKIPQIGTVVVEDDVEIGAQTAIDRPAVGETRIGAGTKIDNLVQIAHGVRVGRNVLLAAQVGIAGSTVIEDEVVLAGQVGVAGHITVGAGVVATAQSGIPNSVPAGAFVSGYPAIGNRDWLKSSAVFKRLPELKQAAASLERRLTELEAALARSAGEPGSR